MTAKKNSKRKTKKTQSTKCVLGPVVPGGLSPALEINRDGFLKGGTPEAQAPVVDEMEEFFRDQVGRPDDLSSSPIGFGYHGPDMRLSNTVARMLLGVTDPKKRVVKIATIVKYDDGSIKTLFELSGGGPVPKLDITSDLRGDAPPFESLEERFWPDSVDYEEVHTIQVRRKIKAAPSHELAVQLRKLRAGRTPNVGSL